MESFGTKMILEDLDVDVVFENSFTYKEIAHMSSPNVRPTVTVPSNVISNPILQTKSSPLFQPAPNFNLPAATLSIMAPSPPKMFSSTTKTFSKRKRGRTSVKRQRIPVKRTKSRSPRRKTRRKSSARRKRH